jgi:hypothetical protein
MPPLNQNLSSPPAQLLRNSAPTSLHHVNDLNSIGLSNPGILYFIDIQAFKFAMNPNDLLHAVSTHVPSEGPLMVANEGKCGIDGATVRCQNESMDVQRRSGPKLAFSNGQPE